MFDPLSNHFFLGGVQENFIHQKIKKKNNQCVNVCKYSMALRYNMATEVLKKLLEWRADLTHVDSSGKRLVPWL